MAVVLLASLAALLLLAAPLSVAAEISAQEDPEYYRLLPAETHGKRFMVGSVHHDWVLVKERGCLDVADRALKGKEGSPCLAVDVGMNDGFYTQLSASYGCHVYSFEMQKPCIALSRNATRANGFDRLVTIINEPVSSQNAVPLKVAYGSDSQQKRCDGGFSITGDNPNRKAHSPFDVTGYHVYHTVALDSFIPYSAIVDFLKIDVEGHDPHVLEGAEQLLKSHRIKRIVVEVTSSGWGVSSSEGFKIYERMFSYGYKVLCVTERKGNVDWDVVRKDLQFSQFQRIVLGGLCIDWEFYL